MLAKCIRRHDKARQSVNDTTHNQNYWWGFVCLTWKENGDFLRWNLSPFIVFVHHKLDGKIEIVSLKKNLNVKKDENFFLFARKKQWETRFCVLADALYKVFSLESQMIFLQYNSFVSLSCACVRVCVFYSVFRFDDFFLSKNRYVWVLTGFSLFNFRIISTQYLIQTFLWIVIWTNTWNFNIK